MRKRLARYAPLIFSMALVAIGVFGAILAVVFWVYDQNAQVRDALVIPFGLLPAAAFLAWLAVGERKTLLKVQNRAAGCWICAASFIMAYLTTYLPLEFVKAALSLMFVHVFIWLALVQITRKVYRDKKRANIAKASGRSPDDPEVRNLANNNLLSTATALAMLTTAQTIVAMETYASEYFSTAAIRVIGMIIGCAIGLTLFNRHPTQLDIKEITSKPNIPAGAKGANQDEHAEIE